MIPFLLCIIGILAIIGTPLFIVMGLSSLLNHWHTKIDFQAIIINFYQLANVPLLQTLPLFAFAGYLLAYSGAPQRLLRLSNAILGWMPGGLAIVTIILSSIMTALTGASGVTIVAIGGLLLPLLIKENYGERFSLGIVIAGGSLGVLFPPSLPVILYGVISETSIDDLYRAGIIPGLLIILILICYSVCYGIHKRIIRQRFSWKELASALWEAKWEWPMPILVMAGIYSGKFAISEAAVITTAYVFFVELVITRDIKLSQMGKIARNCSILVGGILIIMGMTFAVTNYMIDENVPTKLLKYFSDRSTNKYVFLIFFNVFLLIIGCMIEIYAAIVLIVPLLTPIAMNYGIDPVHLGVMFLTNLGIGYLAPPVGLNLFIASLCFRIPVIKLYSATIPFFICLIIALILITYIPHLSLMFVTGN